APVASLAAPLSSLAVAFRVSSTVVASSSSAGRGGAQIRRVWEAVAGGGKQRRIRNLYGAYGSGKEGIPLCDVPGFEDCRMKLLRHVSFVDCPVHDILMATMLNGAAIMDGALFLIAANESCPQPQTSEHIAAVEIMRLQHIIILQNKIYLIQKVAAMNQHEALQKFMKVTIAQGAPVVPISAQLKYNIDGVLRVNQRIEVCPGIVMKDERLIGVGTTMDPTLTRADRLVSQVLGEVGSLPDVFIELEVTGVRTSETERASRVSKLAKAEILMVNIGSMSTGSRVVAVKNDLAKLQLTSSGCTS
ncbi:hypothetical protein EJB05_07648, partial [Eragrostis curvula]